MSRSASETKIFVLQCQQCSTIVGDSLGGIIAESDSDSPLASPRCTLQVATNIVCSSTLEVSGDPNDQGSSFLQFHCSWCKTTLGRVYKTTPPQLDNLRNNYTFYLDTLVRYNLKSTVLPAIPNGEPPKNVPDLTASSSSLPLMLSKTQELVIGQAEQIKELEDKNIENRITTVENGFEEVQSGFKEARDMILKLSSKIAQTIAKPKEEVLDAPNNENSKKPTTPRRIAPTLVQKELTPRSAKKQRTQLNDKDTE